MSEPLIADLYGFDGQSLVTTPGTALAFPAKVMASLVGNVGKVFAVPGSGWVERTANAAARVDRHLNSVAGRRIYIDCGGTYDITFGYPAASIITNAEANWDARRSAGWDLIIATTIPDSTGFDGTEDATRATVNDSIRASASLDAVVDLREVRVNDISVLEDASNLTYWNADGVHWTATTTTLVAAAVLEAIA